MKPILLSLALLSCCLPCAASEAQPVDVWMTRVAAEASTDEAAWTGENAAIRLGASIALSNHLGKTDYGKGRDTTPVSAFTAFWSVRGATLLARWRAGGDLGGDARWLPVLEMAWASAGRKDHRGPKRYWDPGLDAAGYAAAEADLAQVEKTAKARLKELYATRSLDATDLALLRRYQRQLWTQCVFGVDFRPDRLGLAVHSSHARIFGAVVPELRATPLEAVLALPSYRDQPGPIPATLWPLRADGVLELLRPIAAHRLVDSKAVPDAAWLAAQPAAAAQRVLNRPDRVTVLFGPDATDCFVPYAYQHLAALHAAYGTHADFRAVNVTIHDLFMSPRQFFGGEVNATTSHPITLEERARTAKNLCLAFPEVALPWSLDDTGSTVATALALYGGEAGIRLIDRENRLHDAVESAFYATIWADEVEKSLRRLLANGGRRPTGGPARAGLESKGDSIAVMASGRTADTLLPPTLRLSGTVQAVDAAASTLTISSPACPQPLTIRSGAFTRIQRVDTPIAFSAIAPKAQIRIEFTAATWGGAPATITWSKPWVPYAGIACTITSGSATAQARSGGGAYAGRGWIFYEVSALAGPSEIPASRIEVATTEAAATVWLTGSVIAAGDRRITLRADPAAGTGRAFWAAPGAPTPPAEIARSLQALDRLAGAERHVLLDDSVRVSIDGMVADAASARIPVGARIAVTIPAGQPVDALRPDQVRVSTAITTP